MPDEGVRGAPAEARVLTSEAAHARAPRGGDALPEDADARSAVVAAYAMLGRRSFSRSDLRVKLRRTIASHEAVERALDWLERRRLLDDRRYALEAARASAERKGWGRRKIQQWLHQHGIAGALVDEALQAIAPEQEVAQASSLAERQRARGRRPEQVFRFLLTRGFSSDVARAAALASDDE